MSQDEISSVSKATSYEEIGEFWDREDLTDHWETTRSADFEIELGSEAHYYSVEPRLAERISRVARSRGISSETLVNLWLQEKLREAG